MEHDHLLAMFNRALMYHNGWGEQDNDKAIDLYTTVAEAGDTDAAYQLGLLYLQLSQFEKAHFWSKKAADQNNLSAQNNRIVMFVNGHPDKDQTRETVKQDLFDNSRAGCGESQISLATMQLTGYPYLGIEKNIEEGKRLLESLSVHSEGRIRSMAWILLARLENEGFSSDDETPQPSSAEEKVKKISAREQKQAKNIEKALKRKQFLQGLRGTKDIKGTPESEEFQNHFTDAEIKNLEEFSQVKGALKERDILPILQILGAQTTKSGFKIVNGDIRAGGHWSHNNNGVVDPGQIKDLKGVVSKILGEKA
jgi:hypothetical protein